MFSLPFWILGGIFYFLFLSDYFEIKNINISELKSVAGGRVREEVAKVLNEKKFLIGKSSNYFLFSADEASAEIQRAFPRVSEVKIEKVYPEILNIEIEERNAEGVWCPNELPVITNCFYFDIIGVIFESAPKSFGGPMITVEDGRNLEAKAGNRVLEAEDVNFFNQAKKLFAKNFPFGIQTFLITQRGEFEIITSENWRILLDKKEGIEYQFSNLKYLLDEQIKTGRVELEYVDLRLGNRVYYKFLGLNEVLNSNP